MQVTLKEKLRDKQISEIKNLGLVVVYNIIDSYKQLLIDDNLVYEGKLMNYGENTDGPYVNLNENFENFLFQNSTILNEDDIKVIIVIGEKKKNATIGRKTRIKRIKRQNRTSDSGEI